MKEATKEIVLDRYMRLVAYYCIVAVFMFFYAMVSEISTMYLTRALRLSTAYFMVGLFLPVIYFWIKGARDDQLNRIAIGDLMILNYWSIIHLFNFLIAAQLYQISNSLVVK